MKGTERRKEIREEGAKRGQEKRQRREWNKKGKAVKNGKDEGENEDKE